MVNVFEGVPYSGDGLGKRKLVDEKHLLVMQVALEPGQAVPQHDANSNVHLLVLDGTIVIDLDGRRMDARRGDLVPVQFGTPMRIDNTSRERATFIVIKAPHPDEMR